MKYLVMYWDYEVPATPGGGWVVYWWGKNRQVGQSQLKECAGLYDHCELFQVSSLDKNEVVAG